MYELYFASSLIIVVCFDLIINDTSAALPSSGGGGGVEGSLFHAIELCTCCAQVVAGRQAGRQ